MQTLYLKNLLETGVRILKEKGIERPRLESEILLAFVLNISRVSLHCRYEEVLDSFSAESFMRLIQRRSLFEPLEYLIEKVNFYGEEFYISYGALIPRPETEILVEKALELIKQRKCRNVAEIGIGSGAISVMLSYLSKEIPIHFHASDISPEALFNAYVNKVKFNADNLTLHNSAYLDFNQESKIAFDMLVSNPPYIKEGEELPESLKYEPQKALFGGKRGSEILLQILSLAYQQKIPLLLCEMGYDQRRDVEMFLQMIPHKSLKFYQDLAGLERGFVVEF